MKPLVFALACFVSLSLNVTLDVSTASAEILCAKKSNGAITIRKRCKSGETLLSNRAQLTGPTGPAGSTGPTGPSGTLQISQGETPQTYILTTIDAQIHKAVEFPLLVTKSSATSVLKVTASGHLAILNDSSTGASCSVQVRLNGADSQGSSSATFNSAPHGTATVSSADIAANTAITEQFSTTAIFTGLAAGTYTVSLWLRAHAITSCMLNAGVFRSYYIVEEIEAVS